VGQEESEARSASEDRNPRVRDGDLIWGKAVFVDGQTVCRFNRGEGASNRVVETKGRRERKCDCEHEMEVYTFWRGRLRGALWQEDQGESAPHRLGPGSQGRRNFKGEPKTKMVSKIETGGWNNLREGGIEEVKAGGRVLNGGQSRPVTPEVRIVKEQNKGTKKPQCWGGGGVRMSERNN